MSNNMTSHRFKDFTRGGQTTLHNLRMMMQIIRNLLIIFLVVLVTYNALWWIKGIRRYPYALSTTGTWLSAEIRVFLGHTTDPMEFEAPDGRHYLSLPQDVIESVIVQSQLIRLTDYVEEGLFWSSMVGLSLCGLMGYGIGGIGRRQRRSKFIRGISLTDNKTLTRLLVKAHSASSIKLGGVPLVKDTERAHFLIAGTPGTGKSVCMAELLDQIRAQKQRAIVYDRTGDFVSYYYRASNDIILNPLDERCPSWELFSECSEASDFDTLATALIPLPPNTPDPFWIQAARTVFSAASFQMSQQKERSLGKLLHFLLMSDLKELAHLLKGTEAEALVSDKIEKTALSIKTVLGTYLKSLKYLKEGDNPFSIRQWIQEEKGDSWLFVTSRADKHESLKPLISAWLEIAGSRLMSLAPHPDRRIWVSLDEIASLHRLPYLSTLLAESRKFGGCLMATVQSMAQLRDIYGMNAAEALSGLCNTRVFFRTPEAQTAEWVSKSLGDYEVDEPREGFSYGANTIRDGVSLNRQRVIRPVILASQITQLPDLQAYLRLPGHWPITKLHFHYQERVRREAAFNERKESSLKESVTPTSSYSKEELKNQENSKILNAFTKEFEKFEIEQS